MILLPYLDKLPAFLQNIMISTYGLHIYRRRYAGKHWPFYSFLLRSQWWSDTLITNYQLNNLKILVKHAIRTVPYYENWSNKTKFKADDIKCLADISNLPIISKDQLRKNKYQFISRAYPKNIFNTFWLKTSGTTGKPLSFLCDRQSRQRHYAFWTRLRSWLKIGFRSKRATFFGRSILNKNQTIPPFWRIEYIGNNLLCSAYHLSNRNIPHYIKALNTFNPVEIIGYPSAIYLISKFVVDTKIEIIKPKSIITTAETILPYHRDTIENAFSTEITDQYGCTEMALFVSQCPFGTYHIHPEHGIIEVVNKTNEVLSENKEGSVVCTSFMNLAMPLIRYKLNDRLTLSEKKCECGRHFPVIDGLIGRIDDFIRTPNGLIFGRLSPVFKGISGLIEAQVIQKELHSITVLTVVEPGSFEKVESALRSALINKLGNDIKIYITRKNSIPRNRNGKYKFIISKINNPNRG